MKIKQSDPNRGLRLVVISMGVLLIGGMVLLFTLLALGVHKKDRQIRPSAEGCRLQSLTLEPGESARAMRFDGQRAEVETVILGGGGRLLDIDMCSGEVRRQLKLQVSE